MTEKITFDQLPQALALLIKEVSEIKQFLLVHKGPQSPAPQEQLLTVEGAAEFLNLTTPTIYSKVSKGELPVMKRGKRLYFSRNELLEYLQQGRKKSNAEIEGDVDGYIKKKGGIND